MLIFYYSRKDPGSSIVFPMAAVSADSDVVSVAGRGSGVHSRGGALARGDSRGVVTLWKK